ncbi:glutathione S-transferase N-terminal domain-containing protein [Gluconacetobacter entanii]|uniref:Glutathione S-transferase N-terminal domain-containing protein n=1 Tax=Gluconacetobacter entanii TaxID=108528 RepID=A0ABT3K6P0_9PROT|nr:glutathione S-transferase N-terminal domain-containing protein [Gluconacetobacter entanii]MCW4591089.1 glutathione S-transferase N-terminal domain-containing protein [Gluconacetobacter entanii]MCW4594521.1 glutathione S-transferase N-terminal domain-containing protein [Gluconacetobacter entanii]NPC88703.1 glutathione S-transferase [Gluconacetobacter entanii]
MKLYSSVLSPYARKVRAAIHALGLQDRVEIINVNISASPAEVVNANPLCKIPTLLGDDGTAMYDSRVIIEYLGVVAGSDMLVPAAGMARCMVLRTQALGDGIADAAILYRGLLAAGIAPDAGPAVRQMAAVERGLAALERMARESAPDAVARPDAGALSVGCALGFLDARFAELGWTGQYPALAEWYARLCRVDCMRRSASQDTAGTCPSGASYR